MKRYRHYFDVCQACKGTREGHADLKRPAHFNVTFPSRCQRKNECEREIIAAMYIEPAKNSGGGIAR